jgi:hypothetical protein
VEVIEKLARQAEQKKKDKAVAQAEKDFHKTLEKLWPLKSNEKQS